MQIIRGFGTRGFGIFGSGGEAARADNKHEGPKNAHSHCFSQLFWSTKRKQDKARARRGA
jgi:hypothetical protein